MNSTLKLYNTLTRQKEVFEPQTAERTTVYTCGPTVYQSPQIGNWRGFVFYDTLVRTLRFFNYSTVHVLNITDVGHLVSDEDEGEDKLQKIARQQRWTAWEVAESYTKEFKRDYEALGCRKPDYMPKATEHVTEQIELIRELEVKGFTYRIDDGIYFDTSRLDDYGKLAGLDAVQQISGARIEANPQKRQPADFALWKFSPADEQRDMEWESPWGVGFPGWHIECSAMAMKYLGETLDVHAGGVDHINVHHTNEIAQSEALSGRTFSRYWLHNEFLLVDGQKLSKSLGNSYTLEDVRQAGFEPLAFRLLMLQCHYRSQQNFTWEALHAAAVNLHHLRQFAELRFQSRSETPRQDFETTLSEVESALADDLNTSMALAAVNRLADETVCVNSKQKDEFIFMLQCIDETLGLDLSQGRDINQQHYELLSRREQARTAKDYHRADTIRNDLAEQGIGVRDTDYGYIWYRLPVEAEHGSQPS